MSIANNLTDQAWLLIDPIEADLRAFFAEGQMLVHYTGLAGADGILASKTLWMRNARTMSDTKEIHLGREGVSTFINTHGARLKSALDAVDLGLYDDLIMFWNAEAYIHINKTFIASFTPHALLDEGGSAYHWANYGSVALYLDPAILRNEPSELSLYLRPVTYGEDELNKSLIKLLETVEKNIELLRSVDKGILLSFLRHQLFFASVSTKAEAFSDEKEWRIIYTPWQFASAHIVCSDEFTTQNQRCDLPLTKDDGTSWFEIRKIDRK